MARARAGSRGGAPGRAYWHIYILAYLFTRSAYSAYCMIYFAYCGYSQAAGPRAASQAAVPRAASREAAGRISKEETRNTLAQFCSFPVLLQQDLQPRRGGTGVVAWPGLARSVPLSRLSRDHYWQKTRTVQVRRATVPNLPWSRYLKFASPGHRVARAGLCESERIERSKNFDQWYSCLLF